MNLNTKIDSQGDNTFAGNFTPGVTEKSSTSEPKGINAGSAIIGADELAYEPTDTMSSVFDSIPIQSFKIKTDYNARAESPELEPPREDLSEAPSTSPYGAVEQQIVKENFKTQMMTAFEEAGIPMDEGLFEALLSDSPLPIQDPKQAEKIKTLWKKNLEETRKAANLPESWTPQSTKAEEWTPLPTQPYDEAKQQEVNQHYNQRVQSNAQEYVASETPPFSEEEIALLNEVISTNKFVNVPPRVAEAYLVITAEARANTQKTFGLSENWAIGTTDLELWKPINLNIVNPLTVADTYARNTVDNIVKDLSDLKDAATETLSILPPNDHQRPRVINLLKVVSEGIDNLQNALRRGQLVSAEGTKGLAEFRKLLSDKRADNLDETRKKNEEMKAKQETMARFSGIMKIVGPILSALTTIAGAALAFFTFGLSLPLVAAGIAVGIAMTAYSVVDSYTGITASAFKSLSEAISGAMGDKPAWLQSLVKFAIIAATVMVLAVVVFASLPAAAAAATQTALQILKQVIQEVIKQLSVNAMMTMIMASNVIPELVANVMQASGADKDAIRIAQLTAMVIQMLATVVVASALGKATASDRTFTEAIKDTFKSLEQTVKNLASSLKDLLVSIKDAGFLQTAQNIVEGLLKAVTDMAKKLANLPDDIKIILSASIDKLKEASLKMKEYLDQAVNAAGQARDAAIEGVRQAAQAFQDALNDLKAILSSLTQNPAEAIQKMMKNFLQDVKNLPAESYQGLKDIAEGYLSIPFYTKVVKALQLTASGTQIATSSISAAQSAQLSKLLRALGELEKEQTVNTGLMSATQQLMKDMQTYMDDQGESTEILQQTFLQLMNASSRSSTQLAQVNNLQG